MSDKMREEFEAWSKEHSGSSLERDVRGGYLSFSSMQLWAAWQASRAALFVELPEEQPGYMYYAPDVAEAIQAAGVTIK